MDTPASPSPLVLGIGNFLMGDEGVGVHAIRRLEQEPVDPSVHLLDGGTGGFQLLSLFQEYDPIVMIDATMDERPEGSVTLTTPRYASDFPRTLSAHDIGLRDLLESATLVGPLPRLFLVTVSISRIQPMTTQLSPSIEASLEEVVSTVRRVLTTQHPAS
jgi:hydrogenase maturation protease